MLVAIIFDHQNATPTHQNHVQLVPIPIPSPSSRHHLSQILRREVKNVVLGLGFGVLRMGAGYDCFFYAELFFFFFSRGLGSIMTPVLADLASRGRRCRIRPRLLENRDGV